MPTVGGQRLHELSPLELAQELIKDYDLRQGADPAFGSENNRETTPLRIEYTDSSRSDPVSFLIYELDAKGRHDPGKHGVFRVRVERL